jgi:hypothetical protein
MPVRPFKKCAKSGKRLKIFFLFIVAILCRIFYLVPMMNRPSSHSENGRIVATTPKNMDTLHTEKSIQKIGDKIVTFYFSYGKEWAGYVIHQEGNDYYEKSGGVCIDKGMLVDYDGTFSLPSVVAEALKAEGVKVADSFLTK